MTRGDVLTFAPWLLFATGLAALWLRLRRFGRGARRAEPTLRIPAPRPGKAADRAPEPGGHQEAPEPPVADAGASERAE